jgi:hypothetical protein
MKVPPNRPLTLAELLGQLEELWSHCDHLLARIPESKWQSRFGQEWEYADVPRHLAYFDSEVVAAAIMHGPALPSEKQVFMHTHREFNDWNRHNLSHLRSAGPAEYALAQMCAARDAVRQSLAPLDDSSLERPAWVFLTGFAGWRTVRFVLEFCRQHTWLHFTQLRLRLGLDTPPVSPAIIHSAVNSIILSLAPLLNQPLAQRVPVLAVLTITGPGGDSWIIRVANGRCTILEGEPEPDADLKLVLTPETLIAILSKIESPLLAILTGRLQVSGWLHFLLFLWLFPYPRLDQTLNPVP